MDHLREIYMDHAKTAIAIPLYLLTFSLHQASLKIDDQLALMHYRDINETMWPNVSTYCDDLINQHIKLHIKKILNLYLYTYNNFPEYSARNFTRRITGLAEDNNVERSSRGFRLAVHCSRNAR